VFAESLLNFNPGLQAGEMQS